MCNLTFISPQCFDFWVGNGVGMGMAKKCARTRINYRREGACLDILTEKNNKTTKHEVK